MRARNRLLKFCGIAGAVAFAASISGCTTAVYPMDTLRPTSDLTREILWLFNWVTAWDCLVLAVVALTLFGAIFIFSSRQGDPGEPSSTHSSLSLELAWTVLPALILLAITIPTIHTIVHTQPDRWPHNAFTVRVIAHQWWWEFKYPTLGIDTADEVHIPENREIHFELVSDDVIHSFFMPQVGAKRDVVPGQMNQITLTANVPGMYYGQCAEFCGTSHANMRFRVFVDTPAGFKKWVADQLAPPFKPTAGSALAGEKIFVNAPCAICHTIKGISGFSKQYTFGFKGPNLSHFGSRTSLAGSILDNTPQNVAMWIKNPDQVKPGANMPTLGMRGQQLNDLVAYLESLK
ncbi:MAG: cytochrome c oxidase subunit II [Candidatus Binataceae bacterium]